MSEFLDAFTSALDNLRNKLTASEGISAADADTHIANAVNPILTQINAILASQATDEAKLADTQAALSAFSTAFAPTPAPTEVPAPTPAG